MDADLPLLLRLALGSMLLAHGANKVWGGGGLPGTASWFEGLGMRPGWLHARLAVVAELGAGALMCLGLLTPLAGAAFVGLMVTAALTDHRDNGFFPVVLVWLGPGRWSVDHLLGAALSGPVVALKAGTLGLVASLGLLTSVGQLRRKAVA
ncbi:DoxX family protein [Dactylosporangium sp. NPDC051485]|uniref:DoxX family protein n=1 Tax=Dactylosporangium sp. NPDC051485 TaxID=3154846 RepID=UPI0034339EC9